MLLLWSERWREMRNDFCTFTATIKYAFSSVFTTLRLMKQFRFLFLQFSDQSTENIWNTWRPRSNSLFQQQTCQFQKVRHFIHLFIRYKLSSLIARIRKQKQQSLVEMIPIMTCVFEVFTLAIEPGWNQSNYFNNRTQCSKYCLKPG